MSDFSSRIAIMEQRENEFQTKILDEFQQLRRQVNSAAVTVAPDETSYDMTLRNQLKVYKHTEHLDGVFIGDMTRNLHTFSSTMKNLRTASESASNTLQILKTLYFPSITARERKIPKAHEKTFMWAYQSELPDDSQRVNFVDWLKAEKGVFWVQGKPGSGKSTLMKYLASNIRTVDCLQQWAAGKKIKVARFFFWHAGSALQKSQEGLLRSLLFEMIKHCPDLGPKASELRSEALGLHNGLAELETGGPWTCDELLLVCNRIGAHAKDTKFMLFIDGLDEYQESQMTASDLIDTVQKLGCAPNIKLCVSSRPWGVFLDAFGLDPRLTLKLEDLTRNDIQRYITDKFNENCQYRRLKGLDTGYSTLVKEVCKRAQGVFLWVYLAVRDLLDGLASADSAELLLKRLDSFPPELEGFFQHMIDTIPTIYRARAVRIFDIARLAPEPQSMIAYSFVDEVEEHPGSIYQMNMVPMEVGEVKRREDQLKRQLYARCRGLLEITSDEQHEKLYYQLKVDFLHRTVSDFLRQSTKPTFLLRQSPGMTASAAVMCRALVAQLKNSPSFVLENLGEHSGPVTMIENLLEYASLIDSLENSAKETIDILCVADSALKERQPHRSPSGLADQILGPEDLGMRDTAVFIGMCCQKRLSAYVESKLNDPALRSALKDTRGRPLRPHLDYALEYKDRSLDSETVRVLLEQGADPNERYGEYTVWERFLRRFHDQSKLQSDPETQQVIKLLVQHHADFCLEVGVGKVRAPGQRASLVPSSLAAVRAVQSTEDEQPPAAWELIKDIFPEVEQNTILSASQRWALMKRKRFSTLKNLRALLFPRTPRARQTPVNLRNERPHRTKKFRGT